jgi:hypothetical protein
MKKYLLLVLLAISANITAQETKTETKKETTFLEDANAFHLFQTRDLNMDLKFIDPEKGSFGIDYQLNLTRSFGKFAPEDKEYKPNINLNIISTGFVTVKGDSNQLNSIVNELNFELSPIIKQPVALPKRSILDELELTDEDIIARTRLEASMVSSPYWIMLNIHGKHEASQDFKTHDIAVGGTLNFTTSYLNALLDFPFGLLRVSENNNPRHLDIELVYDYVTDLNNTATAVLRDGEENANRVSLNLGWETGIFSKERISFMYNSYYELGAPDGIKENNLDKNYYYQIKLEHPLSSGATRKSISIKYSQGELPPDFTKGYVLGAGFTIDF